MEMSTTTPRKDPPVFHGAGSPKSMQEVTQRTEKTASAGKRKAMLCGLITTLVLGGGAAAAVIVVVGGEPPPLSSPPPILPPPTPPPPPLAPPPAAAAVTFALEASGDVSDYPAAVTNSIANSVASEMGVDPASVTVTVTAGSVKIDVAVAVQRSVWGWVMAGGHFRAADENENFQVVCVHLIKEKVCFS